MASKLMLSVVAVFMVIGTVKGANHHAPAPSVDCSSLVLTMVDCLSFVTNGSTIKKPEGGCCSGLKNVLKTDAACLCEAFKNTAQFGVVLNITKASTLPAVCNVKAPSITNCGISTAAPAGAPANSPTASAGAPTRNPLSPAGAPDTTGITAPTTAPQSSASVVSMSFAALISLFLASCVYI